jgi:hypothetical protein
MVYTILYITPAANVQSSQYQCIWLIDGRHLYLQGYQWTSHVHMKIQVIFLDNRHEMSDFKFIKPLGSQVHYKLRPTA